MPLSVIEFIKHIRDEIEFLEKESTNLSFNEFIDKPILTKAFTRSLEIIGEAVKKIPDDIKSQYPLVEWKAMAGMRDKLIHDYFGIDYELVWDVIKNEIPVLEEQISEILEDLSD